MGSNYTLMDFVSRFVNDMKLINED
jgi:hypothetical protein